jgi:hypothetical protein
MFLLVDSSPYTQAEPCDACKTLIEVGPPAMMSASFDIVKPLVPCRHNKAAFLLPHLMGDQFEFDSKHCA